IASDTGEENPVPGLYAAGEAACVSVHGANRLGANSLLDIVVFGRACAMDIAQNNEPGMPVQSDVPLPMEIGRNSILDLEQTRTADGDLLTSQIKHDLQKTMQTDIAVFRTQSSLQEGMSKLAEVESNFATRLATRDRGLIWNSDLVETLELRNLLT